MPKSKVIGLVMPTAADEIPAEGPTMYPGVGFVSRGVHLRSLTPAGYDDAVTRIVPAATHLAALGADAIMVIGTSLTFYRGAEFNVGTDGKNPSRHRTASEHHEYRDRRRACMRSARGGSRSPPPIPVR